MVKGSSAFRALLLLALGAALALGVGRFAAAESPAAKSSGKSPQAAPSQSEKATNEDRLTGKAPLPSDPVTSTRRTAIVNAVERAAPAVVSIAVTRTAIVRYADPFDDPFFGFFGPQYRKKEVSSLGSGVVTDGEGHIVTNSHVIGNGQGGKLEKLFVTFPDGRRFEASLVGEDPANDLALIRLKGLKKGERFPIATLQERPDNLIGEWVVAIGNPYGYLIGDPKPTVTVGVVSAVNRSFSSSSDIHYHNMIQTDASINPGNSGGALVNALGEVIGINAFIFTGGGQSQGSIGLGFAIPVQKAKRVIEELRRYGYMREFDTGIYTDPSLAEVMGGAPGLVVAGVERNSSGEKAGLRAGDIITEVAGKKVENLQDIRWIFGLFQVGETVEISFLRDGKTLRGRMELEEAKRGEGARRPRGR